MKHARESNPATLPTNGTDLPDSALLIEAQDGAATGPEFLNRDLSWLDFNRRVLHEAVDARTPLLERVKFLGIFTSNLDEFYMKRVGLLRRQAMGLSAAGRADSTAATRQLTAIRKTVIELQQTQADCYKNHILPALAENGVRMLNWNQLTPEQVREAEAFFQQNVFPILTPLAVDPGHPFPFLSNLSESLGLIVHHPDRTQENLFARIKVPETLPRWIQLTQSVPQGQFHFVSLYELIQFNLGDLFPDMKVQDVMIFRITRHAGLEIEQEDVDDLRELVEMELKERRFADVVRLEHGPRPNPWILQFLTEELQLAESDVYELNGQLEYQDLRPISDLALPKLRYEPWVPQIPPALSDEEADIFALIRSGDLLVHHPYESFDASVARFITAAAADPKVLAIKMTLYRTGDDSPFIHTLIQAAEARKEVVCLVELKARFDEERNILLARKLEEAGVHVVYGMMGLKTHTKTALVVRQDPDRIRCYAHIGTGNYHIQTAKLYTDLGLLTANPQITADLVDLFHFLTGRSLKREYRKLLVAPVNMRQRFLELIAREVDHHRAGKPARIVAKMNSLEDRKIIRALYEASAAGVPIELIVRGFCCLRPGVAQMSENIHVISVIGRFLEHSRIFYFRNAAADEAQGDIFIGSADWMYRNLLARVETMAPIEDATHKIRCWELLQTLLNDQRQTWDLAADGSYSQRQPATAAQEIGVQQLLMQQTRQRNPAF